MRPLWIPLLFLVVSGAACGPLPDSADQSPGKTEAVSASPTLVIHGGAGTMRRDEMSPKTEAEYRSKLAEALELGFGILDAGGTSLDAVEATIRLLEDSPLFNAGKGAVFTAEGTNELDASIMDGSTRQAGAVAGVTKLKHPISAARAVMERSPHVLLSGPGADQFALDQGLEEVEPGYFYTERRWRQLEERREEETDAKSPQETETARLETNQRAIESFGTNNRGTDRLRLDKFGTVGAVALDAKGRIAAGTSTGGMTFKRHGRVGDSPIIGAGTYADEGCGVSATGHGEFFIRYAVAHDICARARYTDRSVDEAARKVVMEVLVEAGGSGGIVALDGTGRPSMVFNSEGMYRGWINTVGEPHVAIFAESSD